MTIGVPGKMINRFQPGMEGKLITTNEEIENICTVVKVAQAADPATRTFSVDLQVPNENGKLQAGVFAKVSFVIEEVNDVITVPRSALLSTEGIYELYVVKNDTAYVRNVILGVTNDYKSGIKVGLEIGEEVVVLGQNFLSDGYPVIRSKEILNDSI